MTGIRRIYPSMPGLCWGGGTPGHLLPPVIFSIVREWTSLLSKATPLPINYNISKVLQFLKCAGVGAFQGS